MAPSPLQLSVAVFAHNEAGTVADCIASIADARTRAVEVAEVIVVSSGSTDDTDARVRAAIADLPHMRLVQEATKRGKASAINSFLREARYGHCVFTNADTILHEDALEHLCAPLRDPQIGMTGGHPIPVMPGRDVVARSIEVFWELHHELCLLAPKMGELVAFQRVFDVLEGPETGADEDWIHSEILRAGLQARYVPEAILYNRGPTLLRDFLAHRHRMAVQHRVLVARRGFAPASRNPHLLRAALANYLRKRPDRWSAVPAAAALEAIARSWALVDHAWRGRTESHWRPLASSKGLTRADIAAHRIARGGRD